MSKPLIVVVDDFQEPGNHDDPLWRRELALQQKYVTNDGYKGRN